MRYAAAPFAVFVIAAWLGLVAGAAAQVDPGSGVPIDSGQADKVEQDVDPALRHQAGLDPTLAYKENVDIKVSQVEINDFPTVRAFVSVQDENGYEITSLHEQHFVVTENGDEVADLRFSSRDQLNLPLVVVFVVDISGSMGVELDAEGTTALDLEVRAIRDFVNQLTPKDLVGLISFSDSPSREVQVSTDHDRLIKRLNMLTPLGETTLWDGIYRGMQEILSVDFPARRALIVLSDGEDNASVDNPRTILDFYDKEALQKNQPFTVYSIGLGRSVNRRGLSDIAQRTGGSYVDSPSADDLANLYQDILRQINREYLLEYEAPAASQPGDIIDMTVGLNIVSSFNPGTYTYRSPGLAEALARALWPGLILIGGLLVILILATIFKLNRRVWLTVLVTPLEGKDYAINPIGANIGTSEACEIILRNDPAIMPLHASLRETNEGYMLEASDPDSPIFSGGKALIRKLLRDRDRISLGHTDIVFHERVERPGEAREVLVSDVVDSRPAAVTEADQLAAAEGKETQVRRQPRSLVGISGPYAGRQFQLQDGENAAGRSAGIAVSLADDKEVSRNHCSLAVAPSVTILQDSGSSNGTWLNGKRCQQGLKQTVYAGDTIRIGSGEYRLE